MTHVVALSGGKDSTALALRLQEMEPRDYVYLCTPTGDELPAMMAHWERLETLLGKPLTRVSHGTLAECIERNRTLPNWRMRFCTRELKIVPALEFLKRNAPATLYVGLRADEEERKGLYSEECEVRFPLREWGWTVKEVKDYLRQRGVIIPTRTDCARCPHQRLSEWRALWEHHPEVYADAERMEVEYGATFRSPGRDTKPAPLSELRVIFEQTPILPLWEDDDDDDTACRVCRL